MWGKIIGYGTYHYRYASGREGDWMKIGLANNKQYISVYVCAFRDGKAVPELYVDQFPKASIGRSCIRFKRVSDIDLNILKQVILDGLKTLDTEQAHSNRIHHSHIFFAISLHTHLSIKHRR